MEWGRVNPLPEYLTRQGQGTTDSTGSEDSVRTQVPLPYHLGADDPKNLTFKHQMPVSSKTPPVQRESTKTSVGKSRMDPTISPWTPPGSSRKPAMDQGARMPVMRSNNNVSDNKGQMSESINQQGPISHHKGPISHQQGPISHQQGPISQSLQQPGAGVQQQGQTSKPLRQSSAGVQPFQQQSPISQPLQQSGAGIQPFQQQGPTALPFQQSGASIQPFQQQGPATLPFQQSAATGIQHFQQQGPISHGFQQSAATGTQHFQQQGAISHGFQQLGQVPQPFQQQGPISQQYGGPVPFHGSVPYNHPTAIEVPPYSQIAQGQPPNMYSYAHHAAAGHGAYNQSQSSYAPNSGPGQMQPYSMASSPPPTYGSPTKRVQGFRNAPYVPGNGGINPPFNPHNTGTGMLSMGTNQYYASYYNGDKKGFGSDVHVKNHPSSNLATAPALETSYNGMQLHYTPGNVDRPASTKTVVNVTSPKKNDEGVRGEVKEFPTPGPKPHHLDVGFSSEPRRTETPILRSVRGQSVANTDPSKKANVANWIENTPTPRSNLILRPTSESDERRQLSPPKMLLSAASVDAGALTTIGEGDPFICTPYRAQATNPFAPCPQNNASLVPAPWISRQFAAFTQNGTRRPTVSEALDQRNLPFCETARLAKAQDFGVIRITNIPYSVTRAEILAFLGRNAKIVEENEPIHIIMERVTSKTLDCYVEFVDFDEAVNAVNRFEVNRSGGRSGRLGQRHVEVELSSQEALMKDMFPKAKNVKWKGSRPEIIPRDPNDRYNSGFQGFVTREELVMLVKHVEAPQRSPFAKECPQRPFECIISTLLKYPWYMVDYITIEDRCLLHRTTRDLLELLIERVNNNHEDVSLTPMLLKRVWKAALKCPGFTPTMKDDIVFMAGIDPVTAHNYGLPDYAVSWKYLWTIGPKPDFEKDLLEYYCAIIREATQPKRELSLAEQSINAGKEVEYKLFGDLDKHIHYFDELELDRPRGERLAKATLAAVAKVEWAAIEKILRQALQPAIEGPK